MVTKIVNFGCRLNSYEADVIKEHTEKSGFSDLEENIVIFNSCAVTKEAIRQTKQAIRKAKRENKDIKIIVTGCAAQTAPENFALMQEVDFVIGNIEKLNVETYQNIKQDFNLSSYEKIRVNDIMEVKNNAPHLINSISDKARAFVQIQNGCDHNCTFCIIPFGRGRSRSVPMGAVIEQIKILCDKKIKEIVLTGVDLTSYGADLPGAPKLSDLTEAILKYVPQLQRLRLSSIDSIEIDNKFFEILAYEKRIMPHLHLSLQAGHNLILKRMKRRHLREDAIEFCHRLLEKRPEMVFGADLIAGFPTETEEMFEATKDLIKECQLTYLHVFPFSAHEKVPASKMPQIAKDVIKKRANILRDLGQRALEQHFSKKIDNIEEILVENANFGRCKDYSLVHLNKCDNHISGSIINKKIISYDNKALITE